MEAMVLQRIADELAAGRAAELCLLTAVEGSSPRKPGACLAAFADGTFVGTVGGGALERLVLKCAVSNLAAGRSEQRVYTMDGAQSTTGMICGGGATVCHLLLEPAALPAIEAVRVARARGAACCLVVDAAHATLAATSAVDAHGSPTAYPLSGPLAPLAPDVLLQALACAEPASIGEIGEYFVLPLAAEGSVYIVGCGHVGQALVPVLASLGLNVTVVDDRPALLEAASIPAGVNTLCIPYAEFSQAVSLSLRDYVIVCTSSHATDLAVVRQALAAHPSFVGCLGSKKKAAFIRGKLAEDGLSADDMAQLHMPVGIPLGDETPAEIAISIAAQLIMHRHSFAPQASAAARDSENETA